MLVRIFCALSLSMLIISCGRYDKQYSKIVSDNEFKSTRVQCYTVFNLPFFCLITEEYERTFKVIEIVEKIVEIVVEREVEIEKVIRVHTQTIAREVYEVFRDKEVDIETIVSVVIQRVYASPPASKIIPPHISVKSIAEEVVSGVVDSTPYTETNVVVHKGRTSIDTSIPDPDNFIQEPGDLPFEPNDPEYVAYIGKRENGDIDYGIIHKDFLIEKDNKIYFTGGDGELQDRDLTNMQGESTVLTAIATSGGNTLSEAYDELENLAEETDG